MSTTVELGKATAEIARLRQAMWDALEILGFDLDGQPTPAATIAGMGADGFVAYFIREMHEARRDHDAAIEEVCTCR